jgi:hypothetical protein
MNEDPIYETDYPNWLYKYLVEDCLPWDRGRKISFQDFDKKYTLHDSGWIGIFFNIAYEQTATLAIQWDAVWIPDEIQKSTPIVSDWPYLFIRLTNIEQLSTNDYLDNSNIPRAIDCSTVEEINDRKILAINDIYGGQINIIYQGEETFLAMDKNKCILTI